MFKIRTARPLDAPQIARVHIATWREAYRGILDPSYLAGLDEQRLTHWWRGSLFRLESNLDDAIFAAVDSRGRVVGFASLCSNTERSLPWDGEVSMVYVLDAARRQGAGRALLQASADHMLRRGMFSAGLWVLRENPRARKFYEALGGQRDGEKLDQVGGRPTPLTAYWWPEVAVLAQRAVPTIGIRVHR